MKKGKIKGKHKNVNPEVREKWIATNENWCPAYEPKEDGNPLNQTAVLVRVSQSSLDRTWGISVWGADDMGVERVCTSRSVALEVFDLIDHYTTKAELKSLRFIQA